jgi:plastocyanin
MRTRIGATVGMITVAVGLMIYFLVTYSSQHGKTQANAPLVIIEWGSSNLYSGKSYLPVEITVVIGKNNTVVWRNDDAVDHTVTADDRFFDSGIMKPGSTWTYTFTKPGTYSYHCIPHPWMTGRVIVRLGE